MVRRCVEFGIWLLMLTAADVVCVRWWRHPETAVGYWERMRAYRSALMEPRRVVPGVIAGHFAAVALIGNIVRLSYGSEGPDGLAAVILMIVISISFIGLIGLIGGVVMSYVVGRTGRPVWLVPPALRDDPGPTLRPRRSRVPRSARRRDHAAE